jgi:hypothetical protein
MAVTRRDVLQGLAGLGVAGCTGTSPPPPAAATPPPPRETLADGPTPELLLLSHFSGMYGGRYVTIYADGLVTGYRNEMSKVRGNRPPVHLARLPEAERTTLRDLVEGPDFRAAPPDYAQKGSRHSLEILVSGPRRISVRGAPKDLPASFQKILTTVDELERRLADTGQDAFTAAEPRVLAIYDRLFTARRFADQLTVFANGVLDYRILRTDAGWLDGQDIAHPIVQLQQAPRADLAALQDLLAGGAFVTAPAIDHTLGDRSPAGTTHFVMHRGPRLAEVAPGFQAPAGVRPVLAALAKLLVRFTAPPDEPGIAPVR